MLTVPTHRIVPEASTLDTGIEISVHTLLALTSNPLRLSESWVRTIDATKRKRKSKSDRATKEDRSKGSKGKDKSKDSSKSKSKSTRDRPGDSVGSSAVDNLLGLDFGESNTNTKTKTSSASKLVAISMSIVV